jgi:RHS repeat-associated protein
VQRGTSVLTRTLSGDGQLTGLATQTGATTRLDWDRAGGVDQLALFTAPDNTATTLVGSSEAWAVGREGDQGFGLPVDIYGSVQKTSTTATLGASAAYDEFGNPATAVNFTTVRLGYRGELYAGALTHLRARDYHPSTGRFTTPDPLDGLDGTPTVANPYHYADNDPLNKQDPTGLRPDSEEQFQNECSASEQWVYIGGSWSERFRRLDRIEIGAFVPDRISHLDPTGKIGLYHGDGRDFAGSAPIPMEQSRFFMSLDFTKDEGYIRVTETHPVDGPCGSAWPIKLNSSIDHDPRQKANYFSLQVSQGGDELKVHWSVVHGDRRSVAGVLPTDAIRPSFDGTLSFKWRSEDELEVHYGGDCFPSVEAQLVPSDAPRYTVMQLRSKGPLYGASLMPDCSVNATGTPHQ